MTSEQFAYWLQGFTELNPSMEQPTPEQWKSITEHLKTVFVKVTPEVSKPARQPSYEETLKMLQLKDSVSWPGLGIQPLITC